MAVVAEKLRTVCSVALRRRAGSSSQHRTSPMAEDHRMRVRGSLGRLTRTGELHRYADHDDDHTTARAQRAVRKASGALDYICYGYIMIA
jgi:hypothetical protein